MMQMATITEYGSEPNFSRIPRNTFERPSLLCCSRTSKRAAKGAPRKSPAAPLPGFFFSPNLIWIKCLGDRGVHARRMFSKIFALSFGLAVAFTLPVPAPGPGNANRGEIFVGQLCPTSQAVGGDSASPYAP